MFFIGQKVMVVNNIAGHCHDRGDVVVITDYQKSLYSKIEYWLGDGKEGGWLHPEDMQPYEEEINVRELL
jgi:hypothetical protein